MHPDTSPTEPADLIAFIATEVPEPVFVPPGEPLVKPEILETTEEHVARLLKAASEGPHVPSLAERGEIEDLIALVGARAKAWDRAADRLQARIDDMREEARRVRKLADDLAEVTARLSQAGRAG